jgi:hypothetical protein
MLGENRRNSDSPGTGLRHRDFDLILCGVVSHCMDPSLLDPNNHVPEVSPDDVWGDAAGWENGTPTPGTTLPPKRQRSAEPSSQANIEGQGLRLGSDIPVRPIDDADQRLEILEITTPVVRLSPESPTALKVPRQVVIQPQPVENRTERPLPCESKEWGKSRKHSFRWIVGTTLGVVAIVIFAMLMLPVVNQSNAASQRQGKDGLIVEQHESTEGIDSLNELLGRQSEGEQLFCAFASARLVDDFLPLVRNSSELEPIIRRSPHQPWVGKDWLPESTTNWSVFEIHGLAAAMLSGTLPDFSSYCVYLIFSNNKLQIDWKATTGFSTATFDELALGRGDPSEIRGRMVPTGYYTAVFPESDFQCFQILSTDGEKAVWCYSRREGPDSGPLSKLFESGEILKSTPEPKKVTLRLEPAPPGAQPNQWLLAKLLHREWITP